MKPVIWFTVLLWAVSAYADTTKEDTQWITDLRNRNGRI